MWTCSAMVQILRAHTSKMPLVLSSLLREFACGMPAFHWAFRKSSGLAVGKPPPGVETPAAPAFRVQRRCLFQRKCTAPALDEEAMEEGGAGLEELAPKTRLHWQCHNAMHT